MEYTIVNIVAGSSLNQPVSFEALIPIGDLFSYDYKKYHAAYLKLDKGVITIYPSGKYHFIGVKSLDALNQLYDTMKNILEPYLKTSLFQKPIIKNIVAIVDVGFPINTNNLFRHLQNENVDYEPEIFPGLIWKTGDGMANIFRSGKISIAGVNSIDGLEKFQAHVLKRICESMNIPLSQDKLNI